MKKKRADRVTAIGPDSDAGSANAGLARRSILGPFGASERRGTGGNGVRGVPADRARRLGRGTIGATPWRRSPETAGRSPCPP